MESLISEMARTGGVIGMSLRRWIMPASPGSQAWTGVGGTQTQVSQSK